MSRWVTQVAAIVLFAFLLFVGWDFSQRITLMVRRDQVEQGLDRQITKAQATHTALESQKQLVNTDQFVEDKVRRDEHYVRDGESVVMTQVTPAAPASGSPSDTAPGAPSPASSAPQSNWWQDLLDFLFGP